MLVEPDAEEHERDEGDRELETGSGIFGTESPQKDSSAQERTCGFPGLPVGPVAALVAGPVVGTAW